jgi:hypothetical protein
MKGLGIMDFKAQAQVLFMNFFNKGYNTWLELF